MDNDTDKFRFLGMRLPPATTRRIVVLTGARQVGKTTLSRRMYPDIRYINLDSPENRDALRTLPAAAWARSVGHAILDEAQKEPVIFDKVKYAYDDEGIRFTILTGSSQILLLKKIRESLAGRAFFYELWPLMQCELNTSLQQKAPSAPLLGDLFSNKPLKDIFGRIPAALLDTEDNSGREAEMHLLKWGGMPALLPLAENDRWLWLKNYGYTYLERDLADLARLDDLSPFRKFQQLSALRSGMLLNYSELARDTGISVDTARRYLEYLRLSYQAVLLQPYRRNVTSSVVKTPKLYWLDIGIWRQLTGFTGELTGQLYETMVVGEFVKWIRTQQLDAGLYFYRTRSGREVDLLLETQGGLIGIEIKSRDTVAGKDMRPMQSLAEKLGKQWRGGLVVYTGRKIEQIGKPDIWAVPSRRLFQ